MKIINTTHYEISQTELNNNFTLNNSIKIIFNLSNPIEIYHNLKGNYIVYETIGILYAYPLDIEKPNNLGISSSKHLPNTLRANSKLNIDWIHDLFYWTKESSIAIVFKSFFSLNFSGLIVREDIKLTNFILQFLESTFNNNIFEDFIFPSVMQILERRRQTFDPFFGSHFIDLFKIWLLL